MAVLVEGISVIVRLAAIHGKYPGGWAAFRDAAPNSTLCCDNELARVGFMSPDDTTTFVLKLESLGFVYVQDGQAQDLVVADQRRGLAVPCSWVEFGRISFGGGPNRQVAACRLTGSQGHQLFTPDGWAYEDSLSACHIFVGEGWVPEFMDFLRHEDGLDVYRDLKTGKEVYVGRAGA